LKSEANRFKRKNISAVIVVDVRRFGHPIKRTRFSVHTGGQRSSLGSIPAAEGRPTKCMFALEIAAQAVFVLRC
jgi:hypothetical protein